MGGGLMWLIQGFEKEKNGQGGSREGQCMAENHSKDSGGEEEKE